MPAPRRPSPQRRHSNPLKAMVPPALLLIALLLLIPGVWGILLLAGVAVPNAERDGARTMAVAMLISLPIAALLVAMAWYVWWSGKRKSAG